MKLRILELSAANYLNKFPKIKYLVKYCYLLISYIFLKKISRSILNIKYLN